MPIKPGPNFMILKVWKLRNFLILQKDPWPGLYQQFDNIQVAHYKSRFLLSPTGEGETIEIASEFLNIKEMWQDQLV